jgi:hypothetical protein
MCMWALVFKEFYKSIEAILFSGLEIILCGNHSLNLSLCSAQIFLRVLSFCSSAFYRLDSSFTEKERSIIFGSLNTDICLVTRCLHRLFPILYTAEILSSNLRGFTLFFVSFLICDSIYYFINESISLLNLIRKFYYILSGKGI